MFNRIPASLFLVCCFTILLSLIHTASWADKRSSKPVPEVVDTVLSVTPDGELLNFFIVRQNGLVGINWSMAGKDRVLLPCAYESYVASAGYIALKKEGRWALYDYQGYYTIKKGKVSWERQPVFVTDFVYDSISAPGQTDIMVLYKEGLCNVLYQKGGVVFPSKEQKPLDLFPGWVQELRMVEGANYSRYFIARKENYVGLFSSREHTWLIGPAESKITAYKGTETDYFYCESAWKKRILGKYNLVSNRFMYEQQVDSAGGRNGGLYYVINNRYVELIKMPVHEDSPDAGIAMGNNHFLYLEDGSFGIKMGEVIISKPVFSVYDKLERKGYDLYVLAKESGLSFFIPEYSRFALDKMRISEYQHIEGYLLVKKADDARWYYVRELYKENDELHSQLQGLDTFFIRKLSYSYIPEGRKGLVGFGKGQMFIDALGGISFPFSIKQIPTLHEIFPEVKGYSYRAADGKLGFNGTEGAIPPVFNQLTLLEEREDGKPVLLFRVYTDQYVLYVNARDLGNKTDQLPAFAYCGKCRGTGKIYSGTVTETVVLKDGYTKEYITKTPRLAGGYTVKTTTIKTAPKTSTDTKSVYKTCEECNGHGRHYFTINK